LGTISRNGRDFQCATPALLFPISRPLPSATMSLQRGYRELSSWCISKGTNRDLRSRITPPRFDSPAALSESTNKDSKLCGASQRADLGHDSSDDSDQKERANLESAIRMKTEAIGPWRNRFDDVNNELAIRSGIQIMTRQRSRPKDIRGSTIDDADVERNRNSAREQRPLPRRAFF
jgi:hypothetical protein